MKHSIKVVFDFEINAAGPVVHADISAELDGDGPDFVRLEELANEHQRVMATDAHRFIMEAGPILLQLFNELVKPSAGGGSDPTASNEHAIQHHVDELGRMTANAEHDLQCQIDNIRRDNRDNAADIKQIREHIPVGWAPSNMVGLNGQATLYHVGPDAGWTIRTLNTGVTLGTGKTPKLACDDAIRPTEKD